MKILALLLMTLFTLTLMGGKIEIINGSGDSDNLTKKEKQYKEMKFKDDSGQEIKVKVSKDRGFALSYEDEDTEEDDGNYGGEEGGY
ncbi:hypothetical protein JXR93_00340 [bacterium]|nr:hypothetical protein [bacterium]